MGLPRPVKDEAGFICRKALEKGLVRGRSIEAIVAAAVYAACRIDGVPRTLDELQQVTGVRKKTIGKAYGACLRTLTLRVPPSRPTDYVSRFCSRLGLSNAVEAEAHKILKELEKIDSSMSLSPSGTAAAAIYLASLASGERRRLLRERVRTCLRRGRPEHLREARVLFEHHGRALVLRLARPLRRGAVPRRRRERPRHVRGRDPLPARP